MSSLGRRVLTAILLIPVVVALVLWAPPWLFFLALLPIVWLALWEYMEMVGRTGPAARPLPVYLLSVGVLGAAALAPQRLLIALVGMTFLLAVMELLQRPALEDVLPAASMEVFGLLYVAFPLALLIPLRQSLAGPRLILIVLLLVWTGDTVAYFVGRAVGRHKLAPRISPGKTFEGTAASLVFTVVVGFGLFRWLLPAVATVHVLGMAATVNILAQLGDLTESAFKRGAGVKDSSGLLPGHGGVLDRIDSLLFVIPAVWYYSGKIPFGG